MKKILLLATAIGLLISFSRVAQAENWALWQKMDVYSDANSNSPKFRPERSYAWYIVGAFSIEKQCREEEKKLCIRYEEFWGGKCNEMIGGYHEVMNSKNGDLAILYFKCLPETIDPRK